MEMGNDQYRLKGVLMTPRRADSSVGPEGTPRIDLDNLEAIEDAPHLPPT
jgi:hypothetical protein